MGRPINIKLKKEFINEINFNNIFSEVKTPRCDFPLMIKPMKKMRNKTENFITSIENSKYTYTTNDSLPSIKQNPLSTREQIKPSILNSSNNGWKNSRNMTKNVNLGNSFIKKIIDNSDFPEKTKFLNYDTGKKLLLGNKESLYEKNRKIKHIVNCSLNLRNSLIYKDDDFQLSARTIEVDAEKIIQKHRESIKPKTKIKSLFEKPPEKAKLFRPFNGMSELKTTIKLRGEDPLLYMHNKIIKSQVINEKIIMQNLFEKNSNKSEWLMKN
jgi:hypothetical protein